jgi:hypothetical protein
MLQRVCESAAEAIKVTVWPRESHPKGRKRTKRDRERANRGRESASRDCDSAIRDYVSVF